MPFIYLLAGCAVCRNVDRVTRNVEVATVSQKACVESVLITSREHAV